MARRVARAYEWVAVVPILLLYLPILFIFSGNVSISSLIDVLQTTTYYRMLRFTVLQATLSTIVAIVLALPLAYIISHFRFPGRELIRVLTLVPFVLPAILLVLGMVLVWGNNGGINQLLSRIVPNATRPVLPILYGMPGIVLAHALYNFGICARLVSDRWQSLPLIQLQAASTLGAGTWQLWRDIVLPWLFPALIASASIIFLLCFTSFAVVLILGGGPWHASLEVAIYRLIKIEFDVATATQLAFVQLCITLGISLFYLLSKKKGTMQEIRPSYLLPSLLKSKQYWAYFYLLIILALVLLPIVAMVLVSFLTSSSRSNRSFDLLAYQKLFIQGLQPLYNSVILSLSAMALAMVGGAYISIVLNRLQARTARIVEVFLFIPYCISPIVLSLGYTYLQQWLGGQSYIILFLVHAVLAMPLVVRILLLSRRSIGNNIANAARNLGADAWAVRTSIYLPLLMPAVLTSASLAISLSLGELSAALMLLPANNPTLPVAMYQLMGHYRFFDASRYGILLMVSTTLLFILMAKIAMLCYRGRKDVRLL